jgi:hypothetical protein
MSETAGSAGEAHPEELGHRLVEIENQGNASEPEREGGKGQEIWQAVDDDDGVTTPALRPDRRPAGSPEEREILTQVRPDAGALVTTDRESVEADALDRVLRPVAAAAEREDVHGPTRRDQRLRLPADPRILLVVGMDEHADRPESTAELRGIDHARDGIRFGRRTMVGGAVLPFRRR